MKCVYCPADAENSRQEYHVVPHAAGNADQYRSILGEISLPRGLVCDGCNNYFGTKIDAGVANHPYVQQWRAVYGLRSRNGTPKYIDKESDVSIRVSASGLLELQGDGIEFTDEGTIRVPQPSLQEVKHLQVSRALHKIALEHELLEVIKEYGLDAGRKAVQCAPLSIIAEYVRRGSPRNYRPYGVQPQGSTRVSISRLTYEPDPTGILVGPSAFTGYIIGLPGARFSCTLAEDTDFLSYILQRIEKMACRGFLTTRHVFWNLGSGAVVTNDG